MALLLPPSSILPKAARSPEAATMRATSFGLRSARWVWRVLEVPYNLSIHAPFNLLARSQGTEFGVLIVQKVLTNNGQLQRFRRLPGKPQIQFGIGRHILIGDARHITKRRVEFKMSWEIQ